MSKSNFILTIGSIFIIVGIIIIGINNNKEKYIKDSDYLYDIAIKYLEEENNMFVKEDEKNYHVFIISDNFGITKRQDLKYAYMWVLKETYCIDNDLIKQINGSSIFYKFTFKDDIVINVEIPSDGNEYTKSIEKMIPFKDLEEKVLNYESNLSVRDLVKSYYKNNIELIINEIIDINYEKYIETEEYVIYKSNNIDRINITLNNQEYELDEYNIDKAYDLLDEVEYLNDGGTKIYKSFDNNITLIKCNTLMGNKDIYIGDYNTIFDSSLMCK